MWGIHCGLRNEEILPASVLIGSLIIAIIVYLLDYIFFFIENLFSSEYRLSNCSFRKTSEYLRTALVCGTSDVAASVPLVAALAVAGPLALSLTRSICSDSLYALATLAFSVHLISQPYVLQPVDSDR